MPLRIALVLTLIRTIRPSITARTFWILGLNLRAVIPVTFVPTPPRYLALPRWVIWLPKVVFLPVKWQTRGIAQTFPYPYISRQNRAEQSRKNRTRMQAAALGVMRRSLQPRLALPQSVER